MMMILAFVEVRRGCLGRLCLLPGPWLASSRGEDGSDGKEVKAALPLRGSSGCDPGARLRALDLPACLSPQRLNAMAAASSSRQQQSQPCPLVAILFVASTASRGPQVVFRYPRKPQLVRRLSRIRYYTPHGTNKEHVAIDAAEQLRDRAQWDEEGEDSGDEAGATRGRQGEDEEDEEGDDVSTDSSTDSSYYQGDSFDDSQTSQGSDSAATTDVESEAAMSTSHTARSSNGSRTRSNRLGRLTTRDAEQTRAASRNQASSDSAPHRTLRSPSRGPRRPIASSSLRNQGSPEPPAARRGGGAAGVQAFARSQQQQYRSNDSPARRARNAKAFSHYLGYPIDFLAEMIAPKSEMCNQRFELVVDDLAFVGHPVFKRATEQQPQQEARGRPPPDGGQSQEGDTPSSSSSSPPPVEMLHLVLVLQPPDPSYSTPTLDLTTWLGLWYDNVTLKMTAALWAEEQRCGYVSQQTALLSRLWGAVEGSEGGGGGVSYAKHLSEVLLTSSLARSLRGMFRSLTRQNAQRTPFVVLNDSLEVHLQLPPLLTDPTRMVKSILELGPSIEADDPDVWADAVGNPLDEWTRATGPPLFPWKTLLLLNEPDGGRGEDKPRRYRSIGGKVVEVASSSSESESDDEQHRLSNPADAGIEVWARKFTSLLKPTLDGIPTFADLASLLSWDLQADVYPMARHLVYYKQAKVTDVPRIQNTYTVSPLFDASADLQRFALSFSLRFPEQPPLVRLLAVLSSSLQPFVQHFLSLQPTPQNAEASHRGVNALARRRRCLEVLIWLLRHDVILQQHLRFRLIATEAVKRRARERWERAKVKKEEARSRREEKREWRREKRALKRGAKEPGRRRVGELVPLMAQSAPDAMRQGGGGAVAAAHAVVRARLAGGAGEREGEHDADLVRVRGRARQRSRSAEARERQQQEQIEPGSGREGDVGEVNNDLDDGTARRAASRISSHSRSRSRNPPPLGRIAASGHLVSTTTGGNRSRPGSSSGLRFESHHDPPEGVTTLQFQRRHVSRSRSPSSTMLPPMTPAVVTTAAATATGQGPSSSPDETRGSGGGTSSSGAAEAAASTSASGSRHSAGAQSISSVHSVGGGLAGPAGLSSTPREKAAQILAAEQHQHQQHQQVGQQQQQRKRAASMIRVSSGSSSTGAGPSSSSVQHADHPHAPPSTSSSSGQRGRRRADSAAAASSGGSRRAVVAAGPTPASEYHPGRQTAVAGLESSPMRTFSRSPSQARMRVSGFGGPEEKVWVDGKEVTADTDVEGLAAAAAATSGVVDVDDDEAGVTKPTSTPSSAVGEDDMEESDAAAAAAAAQRVDAVQSQSGRRLSLVGEEDGETSPPQQRASPADRGSKVVDDAAKSSSSIPAKPQETVDDADDAESSSDESSDSFSSSSSSSSDSSTNHHTWDLHRPTLISDPSRASRVENAWIDAMLSLHTTTRTTTTSSSPSTRRRVDSDAEDDDEDQEEDENDEDYEVRQAFFRLLPYLNGRHTIDEVVCREGMRRKQLRVLLGRFREEIMTFVHS